MLLKNGFFYSADKKIIPTFVQFKKPIKRSVKKTFTCIYRISERSTQVIG